MEGLIALKERIEAGGVVGSWEVPSNLLPVVFMPLAFCGMPDHAVHVYEYLEKAVLGRQVSGYPIFNSVQILTKADQQALKTMFSDGLDS